MRHPNQRLFTLIKRYKLTYIKVAELCCCGRTTIYYWTRDPDHKDFCKMSATYLHLLEFEVGEREPSFQKLKARIGRPPKKKAA